MELDHFNNYQSVVKEKQKEESFKESKMRQFMEDYYKNMKEEQGIEINYALHDEDPEFDAMLRIVRPKAKQKTFSQFLAD